jgi:DNA-3-methyladenine glycosylase II
MTSQAFTISPSGPFSLRRAATFGFGQRGDSEWDGVMRLAFCLDGYQSLVGVEVRQEGDGAVSCTVREPVARPVGPSGGEPASDLAAIERQVARVLSLDYDGDEFTEIGRRDPVIGRLQAAAPGLRPPLFYSPYEAAAWAVLSARRPASQMKEVRRQLSAAHGAVFELAGQSLPAFPAPAQLLQVSAFPGISPEKIDRLHGVADAALNGQLDAARLMALGPDAAIAELQQIKGIGPFYSSLIVIRGTGFADVLPVAEPRALSLTARLYGQAEPLSAASFHEIAEPWRPMRTWAVVLIRAAGPGLLAEQAGELARRAEAA